jgi:hypothetical protein
MVDKQNKARRTNIPLDENRYALFNDNQVLPGFEKVSRTFASKSSLLASSSTKKNNNNNIANEDSVETAIPTCTARCNNYEKIAADIQFYSNLRHQFKYSSIVDEYRSKHFTNYTTTPTTTTSTSTTNSQGNDVSVEDNQHQQIQKQLTIGVHIRAGNGERGDFVHQNRIIENEIEWYNNLITQIILLKKQYNMPQTVLFVASDTKSTIATVEKTLLQHNVTAIKVIHYDHPKYMHPKDGTGILFGDGPIKINDNCLIGWESTYIDMMLLSYVDVLIAARASSFTQSLPMSLIYASNSYSNGNNNSNRGKRGKFCELNHLGDEMKCYTSHEQWCCEGRTDFIFETEKFDYVRIPSNPDKLIPIDPEVRERKFNIHQRPTSGMCQKPQSPLDKTNINTGIVTTATERQQQQQQQDGCLPFHWNNEYHTDQGIATH